MHRDRSAGAGGAFNRDYCVVAGCEGFDDGETKACSTAAGHRVHRCKKPIKNLGLEVLGNPRAFIPDRETGAGGCEEDLFPGRGELEGILQKSLNDPAELIGRHGDPAWHVGHFALKNDRLRPRTKDVGHTAERSAEGFPETRD